VETADGTRILGMLQKPAAGNQIQVDTLTGAVYVDPEEITSVWPVEATFLDRMELDMSLGLDFRSATDITTIDGAIDFRVRGNDRLTEASLRTNITRQPEDANDQPEGAQQQREQQRYEVDGFHEYMLGNQRFRRWFGKIESNDSTGVDLRLSGGTAFGKYLVKTNNKWFTVSGGLMATRENPSRPDILEPALPEEPAPPGQASETNLELVGSLRYRYFRFADPERSLDTTLNVYPSLTDSGRTRLDLRSTFKLELVEDLFWSMELWGTHDNRPLDPTAEKTDYGIITSVGWSY
jgi:hypothetical protein